MKQRNLTSAEAKEAILPDKEKEQIDLIPEERLKELLNILLPYGYSHYDKRMYTGVSPFIGNTRNVITIVANDPKEWGRCSLSVWNISQKTKTRKTASDSTKAS